MSFCPNCGTQLDDSAVQASNDAKKWCKIAVICCLIPLALTLVGYAIMAIVGATFLL